MIDATRERILKEIERNTDEMYLKIAELEGKLLALRGWLNYMEEETND